MIFLIGYAFCGSFCTIAASLDILKTLVDEGADILPIVSENVFSTDTRFGRAEDIINKIEALTGKKVIHTIDGAEPIGPKRMCELLIIAPCTGNTLAKIANGITDTAVTMAAKSHLRVGAPLVIALSTNDAISSNLGNIGTLIAKKNIYFAPLYQDDADNKPSSLVSDLSELKNTVKLARAGKQIQPIFREKRAKKPTA